MERGLKVIKSEPRLSDHPPSDVTILNQTVVDDLNGWQYEISLVGNRRGRLILNFIRKVERPDLR